MPARQMRMSLELMLEQEEPKELDGKWHNETVRTCGDTDDEEEQD